MTSLSRAVVGGQRPLGAHRPVPDGGEDALDGVRSAQVVPVLGRVVEEGQQGLAALVRQATARGYFTPYFSSKTAMAASAAARVGGPERQRDDHRTGLARGSPAPAATARRSPCACRCGRWTATPWRRSAAGSPAVQGRRGRAAARRRRHRGQPGADAPATARSRSARPTASDAVPRTTRAPAVREAARRSRPA